MLDIAQIVEATEGELINESPIHVGGFSLDTRSMDAGDFFFALPGQRTDGHKFLDEAFRRGASGAMISEREFVSSRHRNLILVEDTVSGLQQAASYYRDLLRGTIVGITGSWGKTTTKELIASILSQVGPTYRSPGNYNTEYGLPISLLEMEESWEYGVFELALQFPGDIKELCSILKPEEAVVTGIGKVHVEHFSDRDELAREKMELPRSLPPGGEVIMNGDDDILSGFDLKDRSQVFYGFKKGEHIDYRAREVTLEGLGGSSFVVEYGKGKKELEIDLLGRGNIYNCLAAVSMGRALGVGWPDIRAGLKIPPLPQRLNPIKFYGGIILDDSYNANPVSTRAAIDLVSSIDVSGSKWIVLGDMLELGASTKEDHVSLLDPLLKCGAEGVYTYGDLVSSLSRKFSSRKEAPTAVLHFEDKGRLIEELEGDIEGTENLVLIKGSRAMKMEEVVEGLTENEA